MRAGIVLAAALGAMTAQAAPPYELSVDVPSVLGGATYVPRQVVRHTGVNYSAVTTLAPSVAVGALHRRANGNVLFAPAHAVVLGGATYEPRDIVSYNGSTYTMYFDGSVAGVPAHARVDAVYLDGAAGTVMSFDVPVLLGGTWRGRSNLVRYNGAWSGVFDAGAAGIPATVNVIGADLDAAGRLVMTFDIPVRIAGTLYKPGDLVAWTGSSLATVASDAAWPPGSQPRDFSFLPFSGAVPEGGATLRLAKAGGSSISLDWNASCAASDTDYEVYEGAVGGSFSGHTPKLCTTGGSAAATVVPAAGSRYFLVVPRNTVSEGSYGHTSGGPRPASVSACLPQAVAACGGP